MSVLTKITSSMSYFLCCEGAAYCFWFQDHQVYPAFLPGSMALMKGIRSKHQHKNNNDKHPNNQLQKACKRLEFFTVVMKMCGFLSVQSVPSSIKKKKKNWKIHKLLVSDTLCLSVWKAKYFPLSHVVYVLTSNFLVEFEVRSLSHLRFTRSRPLSFAHAMCSIDFFLFNP